MKVCSNCDEAIYDDDANPCDECVHKLRESDVRAVDIITLFLENVHEIGFDYGSKISVAEWFLGKSDDKKYDKIVELRAVMNEKLAQEIDRLEDMKKCAASLKAGREWLKEKDPVGDLP